MNKILILACVLSVASMQAGDKKPTYEKVGDLIKVTYYYSNGNVKEQGFFKDKKLTGTWECFDESGAKTVIAYYEEGKKSREMVIVERQLIEGD
ncbi:membrane-binding protein [Tenacibaculum maritimum]|uniref:membrane-binding protein n=1 Tax=Tenacibaculum maritimum TaxID=107401 RepID=UPI0038770478